MVIIMARNSRLRNLIGTGDRVGLGGEGVLLYGG